MKEAEAALNSKKLTGKQIMVKQHFMMSIASLSYCKGIQPLSETELEALKSKEWLRINKSDQTKKHKKLLVFDLDETLIHVKKSTAGSDFQIPVKVKNGYNVKVSKEVKRLPRPSEPTIPVFSFFFLEIPEHKNDRIL